MILLLCGRARLRHIVGGGSINNGNILDEMIMLSDKALTGANIIREDLTKIILIGGDTQIPAIKNRLKGSFAVPLDYSLDPIMVVAKGAAYASMMPTGEKK